jgi:hypothetical protein
MGVKARADRPSEQAFSLVRQVRDGLDLPAGKALGGQDVPGSIRWSLMAYSS